MIMKRLLEYLICLSILYSCQDLDLYPLSETSSENWFTTEEEFELSVAKLYESYYWAHVNTVNLWWSTDDFSYRSILEPISAGIINGQTPIVNNVWNYSYQCIANANLLIDNSRQENLPIHDMNLRYYEANGRFARAVQYSRLIFLYGNVPFYTTGNLNVDEAFSLSRTSRDEILDSIYSDLDYAFNYLPLEFNEDEYQFATKGAAVAMKARIALYMEDYPVAAESARVCMNLGIYELHADYSTLFLSKTKDSQETIFRSAFSDKLNQLFPLRANSYVVRTAGGFGSATPSWDLLCSYLCTDGLPIDESPLFDPRKPFKNRDPRCGETIVEFDTEWLGYQYSCHPDTLKVLNHNTGELVDNTQNRVVTQFATYNGLALKKFIDEDWLDFRSDNDVIHIRYADVLLMYAEAKIELGEIDQSVLDAINRVRARAYGVHFSETTLYPAVNVTDQNELRKILRVERRMEFAVENDLRYNDLIRWKMAEKVLTRPDYGLLDPELLKEKIVDPGLWFFPETPSIDDDGHPDFSGLFEKGLIKQLSVRNFDPLKQYLWPIPSSEIQISNNITQNAGY